MEIACNLISGFEFESCHTNGFVHFLKKLTILKNIEINHSYSEHLKPNLPNLNNTKSPIERNLLKLDDSQEQNLLRLDASSSNNFKNPMTNSVVKGGGEPRLVSYSEMFKLFSCSKSTIQRLVKKRDYTKTNKTF